MAFRSNKIQVDGSVNIDGSIYQWNTLFPLGVTRAAADASYVYKQGDTMTGKLRIIQLESLEIYDSYPGDYNGVKFISGTLQTPAQIYGISNGNDPVNLIFGTFDYSTNHLVLETGTGFVGIRTSAPLYTLDVSGNFHTKGAIISDTSIKATDTTYGGIYVNSLNVGIPRTSYKTTNYSYRPGIDSGNIFEVSGNLTFYLPGGAADGEDVVIVNASATSTVTISSSTGTTATILNPANKIKNRWGAAIAYYSTGGAGANAWRLVGDVST